MGTVVNIRSIFQRKRTSNDQLDNVVIKRFPVSNATNMCFRGVEEFFDEKL